MRAGDVPSPWSVPGFAERGRSIRATCHRHRFGKPTCPRHGASFSSGCDAAFFSSRDLSARMITAACECCGAYPPDDVAPEPQTHARPYAMTSIGPDRTPVYPSVLAGSVPGAMVSCALVAAMLLALASMGSASSIYIPLRSVSDPTSAAGHGFISYVATLGVGSPPQWHSVVVDTGSAALAVSGTECFDTGTQAPCVRRAQYDPGKSLTAMSVDGVESVLYDKGFWEGPLFQDEIVIGSAAVRVNTSFAAIRTTRDFFEHPVGNTGIWGLGMHKSRRSLTTPLFDQLYTDGLISADQFSLSLCGPTGHMWLGRPVTRRYVGRLMYTPMLASLHYTVYMRDILVDGQPLNIHVDPRAIIDSGSTFLVLPPLAYASVIRALRRAMPHEDPAIWDQFCIITEPALWPVLSIQLDGIRVNIYGRDYLNQQGDHYCLAISVMSKPVQAGAILGATVMQGIHLEFDRANQRIGFAPALHSPDSHMCGRPPGWLRNLPGNWSVRQLGAASKLPLLEAETCSECVHLGGLWCGSGQLDAWVDGYRNSFNNTAFCWPRSGFGMAGMQSNVFVPNHGPAALTATCSALPSAFQCRVPPHLALAGCCVLLAALVLSITCSAVWIFCRRKPDADIVAPSV
eukprot:m.223273 g.223273  ORF g.223273 m.223273 type:complete len:629 (-) comp10904_c0_seq1:450-2336(-)